MFLRCAKPLRPWKVASDLDPFPAQIPELKKEIEATGDRAHAEMKDERFGPIIGTAWTR